MKIRLATESDAGAIAAIYEPIVRETVISFETEPPSADEMAERIARGMVDYPWLVADDAGDLAGYAYASAHRTRAAYRWACDVSIYMAETTKRQGLGRRLYARLFELLTWQRMAAAYAGVTLPNAASVGFHEALGFRPVGVFRKVGYKNGAWRDVGWWGKTLQDLGPEPLEPLRFSRLPPERL